MIIPGLKEKTLWKEWHNLSFIIEVAALDFILIETTNQCTDHYLQVVGTLFVFHIVFSEYPLFPCTF